MNCKNCGYPLFSNDKFCKNCGQEVVQESDIAPVVEGSNNGPIEPVINNGPIVDPTVPQVVNNMEPVNNVASQPMNNMNMMPEETKPVLNDGPIAPVIGEGNGMSLPDIDAKKIEPPAVSYDKIDGPKGVSNVMSMMGAPKEEPVPIHNEPIPDYNMNQNSIPDVNSPMNNREPIQQGPILANVNQGLPTIPKDKKETKSSVIIPTKPKPVTNSEPMNNEPMMNNNQQQPMNNNYNNNYNNNFNNNGFNNNYNNNQFNNNQFNNQFNNQMNNNQQMMMPEEKKKMNPIVIILILIVLGVGGYFGYKYFIQNGGSGPTKSVSYDGYEFKVPESLKTKINSNSLVAYDDDVILSFAFISGSYSDFSSSLTLENFNSLGNTASYMGEKEKNGNKYHLYKVEVAGKNTYIGYTASGVTKIVCFGVEPRTGTALPKEDYLNKAIDTAMSATFNGQSNMEVTETDNESSVTTASKAVIGEENSTGDISDEDVYEDIYVNITLEEINE